MRARKVNLKIETTDSLELKNVAKILEQIDKLEEEHNCNCILLLEIKIANRGEGISIKDIARDLEYYSSKSRRVSNV